MSNIKDELIRRNENFDDREYDLQTTNLIRTDVSRDGVEVEVYECENRCGRWMEYKVLSI